MKLGNILAKVGTAVLKNVVPGAGIVIDAVNAFLPIGKKLPSDATGTDITTAVNSLPPDQQAIVLEKQFDVEIAEVQEWTKVMEVLAKADSAGASTRPFIAKMMAWLVFATGSIFIVAWAAAIFTEDATTLEKISNSWPMALTVLGTPTALLRAYFGMRAQEKKARYNMASGQPVASGLISSLTNLIRSK